VYNTANTAWQKIKTSFLNNTIIEVLVLDGDIAIDGAEGLRGNVFVTDFSREEPLDDVMSNSTSMKGNGAPVWGATSSGVFVPESAS